MAAIFADDNFKCIFLNENDRISNQISQKFIPRGLIDNKPALVQVMAWRRTSDKPLPEPMMTKFTVAYMRHYITHTHTYIAFSPSVPVISLYTNIPREVMTMIMTFCVHQKVPVLHAQILTA